MPRKSRARSNGTHPAVGNTAETSPNTSTAEMLAVENPELTSDDHIIADTAVTSTSEMPVAEHEPESAAAASPPKRTPKRTTKRAPKPAAENGASHNGASDDGASDDSPSHNGASHNGASDTAAESAALDTSPVAAAPEVRPVEAKIPVTLRPWSGGDLPLLGRLMGDPAMTVYVGGPENAKELRERHVRYCNIEPEHGAMYVILAGDDQKPAGSVGFWETEWQKQLVWETGWSVLPEFQGLGVAAKAASLVVELARASGRHRTLHAYPLKENAASNGVCRKAGFRLQGEVVLEDRRATGRLLHYNDWCIDLFG